MPFSHHKRATRGNGCFGNALISFASPNKPFSRAILHPEMCRSVGGVIVRGGWAAAHVQRNANRPRTPIMIVQRFNQSEFP